jgi:hypothetical protein
MPMQAALPPPPPPPSAPQVDNGIGVGLTVTSGVSPTLTNISDQLAPRSRRQSEDKHTSSGTQTPQSVESDWNENKPDDSQTSESTNRKKSRSCCGYVSMGAVVGLFSGIKTLFIYGSTNALAKLVNIGLNIGWQRSETTIEKAGIAIACTAVIAGSAVAINGRLGDLINPCEKLSKCISLALGNIPTLAACAMIFAHLNSTTKDLTKTSSAITFLIVERILSSLSRDFMTMLTRGTVPSLGLKDSISSEFLSAENKDRLHNNLVKAVIATVGYFLLQLAYFYINALDQYNKSFGTDGKSTDANGNFKSFENMFRSAVPGLVLRTIVESLDDVIGGISMAIAAYNQEDVELVRVPVNTERFKSNFSDFTETLNRTQDASSFRIANSVVSIALEVLIPKSEKAKPLIQAVWAGATEIRSFLVEAAQRRYLHRTIPALNQKWIRQQLEAGSPQKNLIHLNEKVSSSAKSERTQNRQLLSGPTDLGVGAAQPSLDKEKPSSPGQSPSLQNTNRRDNTGGQRLDFKGEIQRDEFLELIENAVSKVMKQERKDSTVQEEDNPREVQIHIKPDDFKNQSQIKLNPKEIIQNNFGSMKENTIFSINTKDYQFISYNENTGKVTARTNFQKSPTDANPIKISAITDLGPYLVIDNSSTNSSTNSPTNSAA